LWVKSYGKVRYIEVQENQWKRMNYRAANRAVSRIATPKNCAASPAFYICYQMRMRGKLRGIYIPRKRDELPRGKPRGIVEPLRTTLQAPLRGIHIPQKRDKANWWIDLVLFALFWISFYPDFTGLALHQWLGIAAVALAAWHLVSHWTWVETVTLRFFSRTSAHARIYYLIDAGVMLGFFMILITGLLISTWLNLPLDDFAAWTRIHLLVSIFTLLLVVLKLVFHWRWVATAARRYAFDPVSAGSGSARPPQPVNPVDRRDFLKLSGILGAATVVTIHGLFDGTQEAQAQSTLPESDNSQSVATTAASSLPANSGGASSTEAAVSTQTAPSANAEPTAACMVRCPNGCSYPGRCRKYVDQNGNNLCDNGECL
jgi:hypothetical protein